MPRVPESSTYSTKLLVVKTMLLPMATYILRAFSTSLVHLHSLHVGNGSKYTYIHVVYMYILYISRMTKSQPRVMQEMPAMHHSGATQHPSCSRGAHPSHNHAAQYAEHAHTQTYAMQVQYQCTTSSNAVALCVMSYPSYTQSTTAISERWYLTRFYHLLLP